MGNKYVHEYQDLAMSGVIPGTYFFGNDTLIERGFIAGLYKFGAPVKRGAAKDEYELVSGGEAETDIVGFTVRNVARGTDFADQPGLTVTKVDIDVLFQGKIAVEVAAGSPSKGDAIGIITAPGDSGLEVGDIVFGAQGTATIITLPTSYATFYSSKELKNNTAKVFVKSTR